MGSISVVVTAPGGIAGCGFLDQLIPPTDAGGVQIVVVDGSPDFIDQSRDGLLHIAAPQADIQGLVTEGLRQAAGDWVIVTEDHCRPLPGLIDSYRKAIDDQPGIDLFSGAVDNLTSTSPWSFALFLSGLGQQWTGAETAPPAPTNANLMVRRSAILAGELTRAGGFLNLTIPRLIAAGRYGHCPAAVVDHILSLDGRAALTFQYHCAVGVITANRETTPPLPWPARLAQTGRQLVSYVLVGPWRTVRSLRGTPHARGGTGLRLMLLGLAVMVATVTVNLRRPGQRPMSSAPGEGG
ncbi:MAG: hypothetical protein ACI9YM_000725 [Brevundimonas sp.]|jgi:hypothetical protein